ISPGWAMSTRRTSRQRCHAPRTRATRARLPARSHPKDAEPCPRHRRMQRGGDAEAEHVARLERVEDAVVPEACGGVVGAPLGLVLGADRCGETLLLVGRERLSPGGQPLAPHGAKPLRRLLAAP